MSEPVKKKEKATILIVDDKPSNILVLENVLASADRNLLSATSGKDALVITLNKTIDLIILDVQMPDMDGFEVAQILKSNNRTKDIPIIFATAESKEHRFIMKGYDEGAIDYMFKPLNPEIVQAKVAVLLKVQLQKKELLEKNASLQKSALLINNSADIIGILDAATLKIEEINQAFSTILGYSLAETKGTALGFYLGAEERSMVQSLSRQHKDRLSFETRIYCKDRRIKWLQWNVVIKDRKWFVNARDITEVKQGEKIRNYLATVVKQSHDAIYIHDHEGKIISWNDGAEKMYGYTEVEALRMHIWNIIPEYLQPETEAIVQQIIQGEKMQELETRRITKHGKLIDVLFSASVIHDANSDHPSIAITERDVTHQKLADEQIRQLNVDLQENVQQLQAANQEMESFSYSVSHDLRAPLRALSGYTRIIEEDHADVLDPDALKLLGSIASNARKMGQLIDDLLEFSRLGRKELRKQAVDMQAMVETAVKEVGQNTQHRAEIIVHTLHPAQADHQLLYQVWTNLLSNAIKYSSKAAQPRIEIQSTQVEHEITYSIRDNGAGFNMEYADKLFGVFQRLHNATEFEGIGIGLAIVHRVIAKHHGRTWAEGKIGEGAEFYFTLPC
jgi:PAS domain S-box-containing protein